MKELKIAVQKSGRLYDDSIRLLKECGIEFNNGFNKLKAEAYNFPLEVYLFFIICFFLGVSWCR